VREFPGAGLSVGTLDGEVRLGSARWCGVNAIEDPSGPELWYCAPGMPAVRLAFRDQLRADAAQTITQLRQAGYQVELLSGDRPGVAKAASCAAGIDHWQAALTPAAKAARLAELGAEGRRVLMVGDGLNDAPALAGAFASMSPATAADISQTAADVVFQGDRLSPVTETIALARLANRLVRQNLAIALVYNLLALPLAMLGYVTPLAAAIAMSSSSILVTANAVRLSRRSDR
jgi:Cu2+-exporting ATPase